MYRQTGPSKGNRRAPVAAPGRSRPAAQRGGGGNKAAGSPVPTAASSTVATVSPSGAVSGRTVAAVAAAKASRRRVTQAKHSASREERQKAAAALAQVAADRKRRVSERDRPASVATISSRSSSTPPTYFGRKTAGTPTKSELDQAHAADLLKVNKAGALTTPAVRQVSRSLTKATRASRRSNGPLPGLDPQQTRVARKVLRVGRRGGRSRQDLISAAETGLVESNFLNLPGGDADSQGWRQERTSIFGSGPTGARNVKASAHRFYDELEHVGSAGQNAQAAQGSQYPERYDERKPEAAAIVNAFDRGNPRTAKRLARAKRQAAALGLKAAGQTGTAVGPAPKQLVKRTVVAEHAMREIEGQPYVWGGGHGSFTEFGKDCSGAVGYVLHKVEPARMTGPLTSGSMGQVLDPGPGALTVFYNDEHTFLRLINRKGEAEYWGTSVGDSGAGGLTRHPTPSSSYLSEYNVGHVPGMGKLQALQLGADPATVTGGGTSAGVTLSSSGSTATIDPGAAVVKKGKPGRSKRPIQLTPLQRFDRSKRKLASIGAPLSSSSKSGQSESHPILEELKAKYGSAPTSAKAAA